MGSRNIRIYNGFIGRMFRHYLLLVHSKKVRKRNNKIVFFNILKTYDKINILLIHFRDRKLRLEVEELIRRKKQLDTSTHQV